MTPQEWIESARFVDTAGSLRPSVEVREHCFVTEGANHLAAALEEIARLRAEAGRVVVPELTPDGMSTAAFVEGYRFAASRAHSVPAGRVLKDGEALVPKLTEEDRATFEGMDAEWGYNLAASRANARTAKS